MPVLDNSDPEIRQPILLTEFLKVNVMLFLLQTTTSGGGSGGSLWATCYQFTGSGKIEAKGGDGNSNSGGGAGGRITVNYVIGGFHSDQTDARGGGKGSASNVEPGGPGVIYLDGKMPVVKNIRIDNKGLKPLVCASVYLFFFGGGGVRGRKKIENDSGLILIQSAFQSAYLIYLLLIYFCFIGYT